MSGIGNVSLLLIKMVFLIIPGAVTLYVFERLTGSRKAKDWKEIVTLVFFSVLSYAIYAGIIAHWGSRNYAFLTTLYDEKSPIPWVDILYASLISIVIAFVAAYLNRYKIINKIGKFLKATNRYGDEDVWNYFHNMPDTEWVVVRDHKTNLAYYSAIAVFSDSDKTRELLLQDADVFDNNSGDFLYSVDAMYFSRNQYDLTIEIHPSTYPEFSAAQLNPELDQQRLLKQMQDDLRCNFRMTDNTLDDLNSTLKAGGLYEMVLREIAKGKREALQKNESIRKLAKKTKKYRHRGFEALNERQKKNVLTLNRLVLGELYPEIFPRRKRMEANNG